MAALPSEPTARDLLVSDATRAGIPKRLLPALVAGTLTVETEPIAALREALVDGRKIVVLAGDIGVGKTVAAARYAFAEVRLGRSVRWLSAWHVSRISAYDDALLHDLETVPTLILDELGSEYLDPKGFTLTLLQGLLFDRYDSDLLTIATANMQAAAFKARYGERLTDRVREVGAFIESAGPSLRAAGPAS